MYQPPAMIAMVWPLRAGSGRSPVSSRRRFFFLANTARAAAGAVAQIDAYQPGYHLMRRDIEEGDGQLRVKMTDPEAFEMGKNVASTPGKVVFQNDLMQLLQYQPATKTVLQRPLLIIPPWINKYYVMDLAPGRGTRRCLRPLRRRRLRGLPRHRGRRRPDSRPRIRDFLLPSRRA